MAAMIGAVGVSNSFAQAYPSFGEQFVALPEKGNR